MLHVCLVCGRRQVEPAERCGRCGGPALTPTRPGREQGVVAAVTTVLGKDSHAALAVVDLVDLSLFCTIAGAMPAIGDRVTVVAREDGGFVVERAGDEE